MIQRILVVFASALYLELTKQLSSHRQGLVWQDTTLSLTYDRPCASFNDGSFPRIVRLTDENGLSFVQCCHCQATILNDLSHEVTTAARTSRTLPPATFQLAEQQILLYQASASEYLRRRSVCQDDIQRMQHDTLAIYTSYFVVRIRQRQQVSCSSQILLPDNHTSQGLDPEVVRHCQLALKAYCRLREIATRASRLWLIVQATLSCALLVAGQAESCNDSVCSTLVQQLRGRNGSPLSLLSPTLEKLLEFAEDTHVTERCTRDAALSSVHSTEKATSSSRLLYG
jgi:hypothetical protein